MSLINCPECNNEISDQTERCQFCGYPIKEFKAKTAKKKSKKRVIIITICAFLFVAIAISICFFAYTNQKKKAEKIYADNLSQAISTMHLSTSDAEDIGDLVHEVWYNSIFDSSNYETHQYMGTDFNESLTNLFSDEEFEGKLDSLNKSKESVTHYMKLLSSPPEKYKESYSALKDYYTSYLTFANLASNPDGSLDSYTESYNNAKSNVESGYSSMEMYIS